MSLRERRRVILATDQAKEKAEAKVVKDEPKIKCDCDSKQPPKATREVRYEKTDRE